jgi:hypothetical protein
MLTSKSQKMKLNINLECLTGKFEDDFRLAKCSQPGMLLIANDKNPFDHCGESHNRLLDFSVREKIPITKDIRASIELLVAQYIKEVNPFFNSIDDKQFENMEKAGNAVFHNLKRAEVEVDLSVWKSEAARRYMAYLLHVMENTLEYETLQPTIDGIKSLEAEILNSVGLGAEKGPLLVVTAIARYSLGYWFYSDSVSRRSDRAVKAKRRRWIKKLLIGVADVAGGALGAVGGGLVGGPGGAVAGGVLFGGLTSGGAAMMDI